MFSSTLTEIERSFRALLKRCLHERRSCLHEMARNRALGRLQEDMNKTSFFKILADEDLSSESMRLIPNDFWTRSECKNLPPKVTLKVAWGSSWTVNLSTFMGFYLMERKGWKKFLSDNHLGDDEFLTFTNQGNNCITVDIYQKNCIEILKPLNTSSSNAKNEKMSCVDPVIAESKMKKKVVSNVNRASSSSSSAPTFSLTIKKSHLTLLIIPLDFANEHMPKGRAKFVIHDPKGKPWDVTYVPSNASKLFSSGWRILAKGYGLAVGDLCTFRLVKPKEMVLEVLHASP
ncbi:B3 domain-containing protein At5g18090-like isoform X1 [Raphanus sativus]|uniref:B3 domain-containing protein At5g18090-like isoform X1 n=1 Tax=Raphanus sativus TaxID=3726 RepID=A0A9W3DMQ6_RAPSA|nr:B3 domain-containing protein At5g18090-like isoform X1 [Raphanus sativus]